MPLSFFPPTGQKSGLFYRMLKQSYAELVASDPEHWESEEGNWAQFDRDVFEESDTVGDCVFLSLFDLKIAGFASWDPRGWPQVGMIGHNCILPEFRNRGFGSGQIREILRRFREQGFKQARVVTNTNPFFVPAQRMYSSLGFRELRRIPWDIDPEQDLIEYGLDLQKMGGIE